MVNKTLARVASFESALFLAILADAENIFSGEWIYNIEYVVVENSTAMFRGKIYKGGNI